MGKSTTYSKSMTNHLATIFSQHSFLGGCNRAFRHKWFDEYGWWFVYSSKLDGAFCVCCALFTKPADRKKLGVMINSPFAKWHHKSDVIGHHPKKVSHAFAVQEAELFIQSVENPETTIPILTDSIRQINMDENRHILKSVAETVLYCGRQCIALRGDNEHLQSQREPQSSNKAQPTGRTQPSGNPGNFLALMKLLANHDKKLKQHMESPKLRNATYLSPQTQNEMIDVIGKLMIQAKIVEEIKEAQIYTIMVDEVTSHNIELMPLCIRFVDKDCNIREELLEICAMARITGKHIASTVKGVLSGLGIHLADCRGQGYDGASNMSSENVGVQALIKKDAPKAVYTHCSGHCLNLVIAHSCAIPIVRNTLDKMKSTVLFFTYSPKREGLLKEVAKKGAQSMGQMKPLIDVCRTRWAARHEAYSHFYNSFIHIIKSLEVISLGQHSDEYSQDVTTGWACQNKVEARGLLSGLETFDFVITFVTVYQFRSHLAGITVKL